MKEFCLFKLEPFGDGAPFDVRLRRAAKDLKRRHGLKLADFGGRDLLLRLAADAKGTISDVCSSDPGTTSNTRRKG